MRTNPWIAVLGPLLYKAFSKIADRLTSKAADALTEGRPTRVVPIYGPDNTVVREVILDD